MIVYIPPRIIHDVKVFVKFFFCLFFFLDSLTVSHFTLSNQPSGFYGVFKPVKLQIVLNTEKEVVGGGAVLAVPSCIV